MIELPDLYNNKWSTGMKVSKNEKPTVAVLSGFITCLPVSRLIFQVGIDE